MANVAEAAPSNLQELTLSPRSDTDSSASESPVLDAGMESSVSIAGSLDSPLDEKASRPSFLRVDSLFRGKVSKCSLDASEKARILGTLGFVDIASKAINCGMEYGAVPSLAADDSSTGGSYFVRGADQSPIGVFKVSRWQIESHLLLNITSRRSRLMKSPLPKTIPRVTSAL